MTMLQIAVTMRDRNKMTIPREVIECHNLLPGQKLVIVDDTDQPGQFAVRVILRTYAGALASVFGTSTRTSHTFGKRENWSLTDRVCGLLRFVSQDVRRGFALPGPARR